jgi:tRNA threonylcarbamoyl adenosine modification protein YeaZ
MTRRLLLAIDTSGTNAAVALGEADGSIVAQRRWAAGYRHGEELLTRIDEMIRTESATLGDLCGVIAGTGPGAFTGLRVGIATAKALARGLGIPIAGVPTSGALLTAANLAGQIEGRSAVLMLPAGPSDRVVVSGGAATLVKGGDDPELAPDAVVVAVDLPGRASEDATARGLVAEEGLPAALLHLGAARLAANPQGDDISTLVPEYVTLPRGVPAMKGEVRWSRDHR